jgi:hypothetical protein
MKFQSQFTGEQIELFLSEVEKLMAVNYDEDLAFDTSEIVITSSGNLPADPSTTSVLGKAMLGYLVLA